MDSDRSNKRKLWKKEVSAGGIVYKKEQGANLVLLVLPEKGVSKEAWTFPKGWVGDHEGETLEETALREVREEGGVAAEIEKDLGQVNYFFVWDGENVSKTVHY